MEPSEFDFSTVCRVCKQESAELRSLFTHNENESSAPTIQEMLMACASVKIDEQDELPHSICPTCMQDLETAFKFKVKCEDSDASMRQYLDSFKNPSEVKADLQTTTNILDHLNSVINTLNNKQDCEIEIHEEDPDIKPNIEDELFSNSDLIQFLDNNQVLLICRTCSKCFTTLDGMKCHKRIHTGSLFACKVCGKQYTRQAHLQRHELSHSRSKVHVCKICSKTLTRIEHLKRHLITHLKDKPYTCPTCNRGFNRAEHLANHADRCKGDRIYICDICNKGFNRADSLDVHKKMHGDKIPVLPTLEDLDNIEDHYLEIDCNDMVDVNEPFSDSDADITGETQISERLVPEVDVGETVEAYTQFQQDTAFATQIFIDGKHNPLHDNIEIEESIEPSDTEETPNNYMKVENNDNFATKEDGDDSDNSTHSEYLPAKASARPKRKRGRPRKHPSGKRPGKRGRPRLKKKEVKLELDIAEEDEQEEEEGEFPCPACGQEFNKMSILEQHASIHEGLKLHICSHCNKEFSRINQLKRHLLSHSEEKTFKCAVCSKGFNRKDHLIQHKKLHQKNEEVECNICNKTFTRTTMLMKHKANKHGDKIGIEKQFMCTYCSKAFTTEKYRDIHMKGHMGDKKFQCRTCDKTFLSKSHLTEHMKFHNENSKKFLCSECGQRFIRNDYLVIHMRRHRGEKPFKCQYCGKGFPRTTDLTVHERYHTGEKTHLCTICGRGFGRAYNLTVHMRTHTGERPYRCTYCDAAFAQGNDLKAHVRRHTGERFQCDFCTESFLMGYLLTQHKRNVHGLNVVSHIRRLQPVNKTETPSNPDDPPITIPLPAPVVPTAVISAEIPAKWTVVELQQEIPKQEDDP